MEKTLLIILGILFLINLIPATSVGTIDSDMTEGKVVYTPPEAPINYSLVPTVNSSGHWDDLDVPTDITNSEFWYNHTSDVFSNYNDIWAFNHTKAVEDIWWNDFISTYNDTYDGYVNWTDGAGATDDLNTTGTGTFGDLIASNFYVGGKSILEPESPTPYGIDNTGLVGYWTANGNALDYSGYGNDGTLYDDTTYSDGVFGTGFEFDGDGDYVEVNNDDSLDFTNSNFSVGAWVNYKGRTSIRQYIVIKKRAGGNNNPGWTFQLDRGGTFDYPQFRLSNGSDSSTLSTTSVDFINYVDTWTHLFYTINQDTGTVSFYLNGVLNDSDVFSPITFTDNGFDGNQALRIGGKDGVSVRSVFNGTIDEVLIFNRSLSATEIQALYNSGNKLYSSGSNLTYPNDVTIGGILHAGIIKLLDNVKLFFGSADDASIYYDGNDLIINPKEVGSGSLNVVGDVNITGDTTLSGNLNVSENIYVGGCIQYNCSDSCITLGSCL